MPEPLDPPVPVSAILDPLANASMRSPEEHDGTCSSLLFNAEVALRATGMGGEPQNGQEARFWEGEMKLTDVDMTTHSLVAP